MGSNVIYVVVGAVRCGEEALPAAPSRSRFTFIGQAAAGSLPRRRGKGRIAPGTQTRLTREAGGCGRRAPTTYFFERDSIFFATSAAAASASAFVCSMICPRFVFAAFVWGRRTVNVGSAPAVTSSFRSTPAFTAPS